ncbi:MAG TPA: hypothetical protein VNI78_10305 [Vicinamibacterales bacterium]|nr:hypothetical protein [Vicinamibacterales bacterium]
MLLIGFGAALIAYARSLPPSVPLGTNVLWFVASRMSVFALALVGLNAGLLGAVDGVERLRSSRIVGAVEAGCGVLLVFAAGAAIVLVLLFSFQQY